MIYSMVGGPSRCHIVLSLGIAPKHRLTLPAVGQPNQPWRRSVSGGAVEKILGSVNVRECNISHAYKEVLAGDLEESKSVSRRT